MEAEGTELTQRNFELIDNISLELFVERKSQSFYGAVILNMFGENFFHVIVVSRSVPDVVGINNHGRAL